MAVTSNLGGTSELHWTIGLAGPSIYFGSDDPTVTPPTAVPSGFKDGDLYVRNLNTSEGLWMIENGTWFRHPSGGAGGTFNGNLIVTTATDPSLTITDTTTPTSLTLLASDSQTSLINTTTHDFAIGTDNTVRWRIDSTGDLLPEADNTYDIGSSILQIADTFSNRVILDAGVVGTPSLTFNGDLDTGLYNVAADSLGFTTGGVGRINLTSTEFIPVTDNTVSLGTTTNTFAQVNATVGYYGDGAVGTPSITFDAEQDTGFYRIGADAIGITLGGVETLNIDTTTVNILNGPNFQVDSVGNPIVAVKTDAIGDAVLADFNDGGAGANGEYSAYGFRQQNSANTTTQFGSFRNYTTDVSAGTEDSEFRWALMVGGVLTEVATLDNVGVFSGTATQARYADLAERYQVSGLLNDFGTVVVVSTDERFEASPSVKACDETVIGVISHQPAIMMNSDAGDDDTHPYIALRGRVWVKCDHSVRKGSLLVTSGTKGVARAAKRWEKIFKPHAIFAKALSSDMVDGKIECIIL